MKSDFQPFNPDPSLAEEWDNPAMAEFKRREEGARVAFEQAHPEEEWLVTLMDSNHDDELDALAQQSVRRFPFRLIRLHW